MEDIWFTIDFKINYEIIHSITNLDKLLKKRKILREIVQRMTAENALAHLFLAIVEYRLGCVAEASRLLELARSYRDASAFWRLRFDAFNLNPLLESYCEKIKGSDVSGGVRDSKNL